MALPWIEKYRPKSFAEVVDQEEAKYTLASWICTRYKAPREFCARGVKREIRRYLKPRRSYWQVLPVLEKPP